MKRLAFVIGDTDARLHRFNPCARRFRGDQVQIRLLPDWWGLGATPLGTGWKKIAVAADIAGAHAALDTAVTQRICQ